MSMVGPITGEFSLLKQSSIFSNNFYKSFIYHHIVFKAQRFWYMYLKTVNKIFLQKLKYFILIMDANHQAVLVI